MESLLLHRCTIQTRTGTTNDFGEVTYSYANTYTDVHCRFTNPRGSMQRLESGESITSIPKIFFKSTQTISEENRVVGTTGFTDTYSVEKVKNIYDGVSLHHIECELKKVV